MSLLRTLRARDNGAADCHPLAARCEAPNNYANQPELAHPKLHFIRARRLFTAPLGIKTAGGTLKPKVYIETSVISYLTARPSNDLRAMANQNATVEWWETQRSKYDLVISEFVIAEAGLGHPEAAKRRLAAIDNVMELQTTEEVRALGKALINLGALPAKAEVDAYHVAVAAVNGVEYLLTWNCTHIANAHTRPKIEAACRSLGYEPPIICTPDELTES